MKMRKMARQVSRIVLAVMTLLSFTACDVLPLDIEIPWLTPKSESATQTQLTPQAPQVTPEQPLDITQTSAPPPTSLTVWLPPDMDPEGADPSAEILKARLDAFETQQGIDIVVRIKSRDGAGGLLDALTATSAAAPAALPDVIALSRNDLEMAALKSLVFTMDGKTTLIDAGDWYPYAHDLSFIQGSLYGIPFTGDAQAIVYRSDIISPAPLSWNELNNATSVVAFAANDPQAQLTLALYQAAGGAVMDNQRRPTLEITPLADVLALYDLYVDISEYRNTVLNLTNTSQAWQAYVQGDAEAAIVPVSTYLREKPQNSGLIMIPPVKDLALTTGSGWVWALATPQIERQNLAVALMEWLSDAKFLAEWNAAYGGMPPRPSSVEFWSDANLRSMVNQISGMTILEPSRAISMSLGVAVREAVVQVIRDGASPGVAAQQAVESVQ